MQIESLDVPFSYFSAAPSEKEEPSNPSSDWSPFNVPSRAYCNLIVSLRTECKIIFCDGLIRIALEPCRVKKDPSESISHTHMLKIYRESLMHLYEQKYWRDPHFLMVKGRVDLYRKWITENSHRVEASYWSTVLREWRRVEMALNHSEQFCNTAVSLNFKNPIHPLTVPNQILIARVSSLLHDRSADRMELKRWITEFLALQDPKKDHRWFKLGFTAALFYAYSGEFAEANSLLDAVNAGNEDPNIRLKSRLIKVRFLLLADQQQTAISDTNQRLSVLRNPAEHEIEFLEAAGVYEFSKDKSKTLSTLITFLQAARDKVYKSKIMFYLKMCIRNGWLKEGLEFVTANIQLQQHPQYAWVYIQLCRLSGEQEAADQLLLHYFPENSRSGEFWTEVARFYLNPFSPHFDLKKAEAYLQYATFLTPQYGDGWIELLRVKLIRGAEYHEIKEFEESCAHQLPLYGLYWSYFRHDCFEPAIKVIQRAHEHIAAYLESIDWCYDQLPEEYQPDSYYAPTPMLYTMASQGILNHMAPIQRFDLIFDPPQLI
jgi:hypothetical protein